MSFESNLVANTITGYVQKRFELDAALLPILSMGVLRVMSMFMSRMDDESFNIFDYMNYVYVAVGIYTIYYIINKYGSTIANHFKKEEPKPKPIIIPLPDEPKAPKRKYYEIKIYNITSVILNISKFINIHPEFFDIHVGQIVVNYPNDEPFIVYNDVVPFHDTHHDVLGRLTMEYTQDDEGNCSLNLTMVISKDEHDKKDYIKQIEDYIKYQMKHGDQISLNYYKVLSHTIVSHNFYEEKISKWQDDIVMLRNEFFSPHKDYLFSIMENKASGRMSTCWNNLILHGEPGTGKSSFIYRIAVLFKMSIISVDISLYLDKKRELYAMFHGEDFHLPDAGSTKNPSHNCIIILEEFDNAIKKLMELENIYRFKKTTVDAYFRENQMKFGKRVEKLMEPKEPEPSTDDAMDMDFENPNFSMRDFMAASMRENSPKSDVRETIGQVNNELGMMINQLNEENKSDILRLGDLLELFQGPVPIKDRMIIATTNNFKDIVEELPALFRPGRLTPIEFTYIDWDSFCELCLYYFGSEPDILEFDFTIPTSQLVELAIKHSTIGDLGSFLDNVLYEIDIKGKK